MGETAPGMPIVASGEAGRMTPADHRNQLVASIHEFTMDADVGTVDRQLPFWTADGPVDFLDELDGPNRAILEGLAGSFSSADATPTSLRGPIEASEVIRQELGGGISLELVITAGDPEAGLASSVALWVCKERRL